MEQTIKFRIPTIQEWERLMEITHEDDAKTHWNRMGFWTCYNRLPDWDSIGHHRVCGLFTTRPWTSLPGTSVRGCIGFRPAFDSLPSGCCPRGPKDGESVAAATLYMNGTPVKVPQDPTRGGDIEDYIPHSKLTFGPAIDDPAYVVTAIKAGGVFIADRVLLKNIAYTDIESVVTDAFMSTAAIVTLPPGEVRSPDSVTGILNLVARACGYDVTPRTAYDCTKIRVAQNIQAALYQLYETENFDPYEAKMLADVNADETLADYEVAAGDGFAYEAATIHEVIEGILMSEEENFDNYCDQLKAFKAFADTLWSKIDDNRRKRESSNVSGEICFGKRVLRAYVNNETNWLIFALTGCDMYELLKQAGLLPEGIKIRS